MYFTISIMLNIVKVKIDIHFQMAQKYQKILTENLDLYFKPTEKHLRYYQTINQYIMDIE